jgi:hypothetical protein
MPRGYTLAAPPPARPGYRRAFVFAPGSPVAKPNYAFEKRQRELEKKRKKEEKAQRKASQGARPADAQAPDAEQPPAPDAPPTP